MYFSVHKGYFYPNTGWHKEVGIDEGKGYTVNIPLCSAKMQDEDYLACFDKVFIPIAKNYNPDLVIVSAGFDPAAGDTLGPMSVSPNGFACMLHKILSLANGKVVCSLEGGYGLASTAAGAAACVDILLGGEPDYESVYQQEPSKTCLDDIAKTITHIEKYWTDALSEQSVDDAVADLANDLQNLDINEIVDQVEVPLASGDEDIVEKNLQ
eukprot:TRINITY_DN2495_c0_g3_i2.p2 TRINITY_DN2495_c0_g3~~TRINITY_DN2495_c0_g3_i2.p2  ORF type:complete len:211 (-),score=67.40 TRINITY_DN2495_c0_g3_i2:921-1553(-)